MAGVCIRPNEKKDEIVTDNWVLHVEACKEIARVYWGRRGVWAYEAFDFINATYFDGKLPWPLIQWGLTPHGGCLGLTKPSDGPPVITLHPSILEGSEKPDPWGISPDWLGACYAFDVVLHESMHVGVAYLLGGWKGKGDTSHNNSVWIAEVNRIAPMLGLNGVQAGFTKPRRVAIQGCTTKTGKPETKVVRASDGNVPHCAVATFPLGVRRYLGTAAEHYLSDRCPVKM
jgi:hypothetical protein